MSGALGVNLEEKYRLLFERDHSLFRRRAHFEYLARDVVDQRGMVEIDPLVEHIYAQLRAMTEKGEIRFDAALFLIKNIVTMLILPYLATLEDPTSAGVSRLAPVMERREFEDHLYKFFDMTQSELRSGRYEKPCSGHAAMQAVDRNWGEFAAMFGWA